MTLTDLCLRLESAQARQNEAMALAAARLHPGSGAFCERLKGGFLVHLGPGHMLNQALCLGLGEPLDESDLEHLEAVLGSPTVLELSAGAAPALADLLGRRGYRIRAFQQVWMRDLDDADRVLAPVGDIRPIEPGQGELFARVVGAGFFERNELDGEGTEILLPGTRAEGTTCFLAWVGDDPAAGGTLAVHGDVATLSGTSVRPAFRGRGLQGALIRTRLAHARAQGASLACSASLPGGASQASLQRCGFRVAYPKVEMVRGE